MCRPVLILGAFAVFFVATAYSEFRIIYPTYRPPPRPRSPTIRIAREAGDELLLHDDVIQLHTERPLINPDIAVDPTRRYVRSLSTPGRGRSSGSSKGSRGHDTGPTHPGYNRRNAREASDEPLDHFNRWPSTEDSRVSPFIYEDINLDPSVSHAGNIPSLGGRLDSTSGSSFGHDTGATYPGYNHRDTRSLKYPNLVPPFNPRPIRPWNPPSTPDMPGRPRFPIYVA